MLNWLIQWKFKAYAPIAAFILEALRLLEKQRSSILTENSPEFTSIAKALHATFVNFLPFGEFNSTVNETRAVLILVWFLVSAIRKLLDPNRELDVNKLYKDLKQLEIVDTV